MCYIAVNDISKMYACGDETVPAVSHVSFTVEMGEFIAVTGPSGCGKSTLLHIMGGLNRPSSGSVTVQGRALYGQSSARLALFRRREAGIVYQFYNLVPELTARENLILPALMDGRKIPEKQVEEIFELLGMPEKKNFYPSQLSGGQQQKIAVGRALINHPPLLLADEPTGNLDTARRNDILRLFHYLNREEGMTIVLVTHDSFVARSARRNIQMRDGKRHQDFLKDIREVSGGTHFYYIRFNTEYQSFSAFSTVNMCVLKMDGNPLLINKRPYAIISTVSNQCAREEKDFHEKPV